MIVVQWVNLTENPNEGSYLSTPQHRKSGL